MNGLERIRCAARRQPVDQVPVAPYMGNHGARVAGVRIGDYCQSGRLMAEAQYRAWQVYGHDVLVAQSDNYYIAEGFGVKVEHYDDATPTLKTPALRTLDDVDTLRVPTPGTDGRMPVYLEAIHRLAEMARGQVAVRAPGTGPFSLASHLLGTEQFLVEIAMAERDPGNPHERALERLMDLATDALIAFARACLEAGAQLVQAGDSLASPDMISPATYRKWAWPAECRFFGAINPLAERYGAATILHICGDTTTVLDSMADTGAHILELDHKVSLQMAKKRVGDRVCLMGNLDPVELLWRGTPGAVSARRVRRFTMLPLAAVSFWAQVARYPWQHQWKTSRLWSPRWSAKRGVAPFSARIRQSRQFLDQPCITVDSARFFRHSLDPDKGATVSTHATDGGADMANHTLRIALHRGLVAVSLSLVHTVGITAPGDRLFPASLEHTRWLEFSCDGFSMPVSGVVFGLDGIGYVLGVIGEQAVRGGGQLSSEGTSWTGIVKELPQASPDCSGASVAVDFALPAGQSHTVRFLLAWYSPTFIADKDKRYTTVYATRYDSAKDVARRMVEEYEGLLRRVLAWQEVIYADKDIPIWLRDTLIQTLCLIPETSSYH